VSPSEPIVVVKRLRLADGETMAIEMLHIPEALVPGLAPKDFDGSFYELLASRYGIEIAGGIQAIEPTVTNEEEAAGLGVPYQSVCTPDPIAWPPGVPNHDSREAADEIESRRSGCHHRRAGDRRRLRECNELAPPGIRHHRMAPGRRAVGLAGRGRGSDPAV